MQMLYNIMNTVNGQHNQKMNQSEMQKQIEQQKSNKNRLITVLNYDIYQKSEQQNEQQLNNNRTIAHFS